MGLVGGDSTSGCGASRSAGCFPGSFIRCIELIRRRCILSGLLLVGSDDGTGRRLKREAESCRTHERERAVEKDSIHIENNQTPLYKILAIFEILDP
ncbi:unnamed protein product [Amaranthus hypochondriacus]